MTRLPLLLLCILFQLLVRTTEALNAAGGAETAFFYQAYLLERQHVTDPKRRLIAPKCPIPAGKTEPSFAEFVEYISSEEARGTNDNNKARFKEISDNAGNTTLVETSRNLREAGFMADYDQ
ncbi:hypothetical protein BDV10DRAFT_190138 [Aspergillus recurvatus]